MLRSVKVLMPLKLSEIFTAQISRQVSALLQGSKLYHGGNYGRQHLRQYCTEKLSRKYYVAILRKQPDYNQKNEGMTSSHTFKSVVVDASKGNSSVIALVMDTTQAKFATNHTIFGSNAKSTIAIGLQVTGNNVIKAAIQSSMHFQTSR